MIINLLFLVDDIYGVNVQFEGSSDDEDEVSDDEETQMDDTIPEINLNKIVNSILFNKNESLYFL